MGMAAARLAPYDWPKAESLLNRLEDPGDYNRFLDSTISKLAATDLARAKSLLDKFKLGSDYHAKTSRIKLAVAIAKEKPDEAIELVNSIKEGAFRVQGLVRVAEVIAKSDPSRSRKLIDTAFEFMENRPEDFRSWSNYGGRAAFAVLTLAEAKKHGHPELATLTARTLAMRPVGYEAHSPENRNEQVVNVTQILAMVDPVSARHLLASIAPPDEFVTKAMNGRREWLFALAMADPKQAKALIDRGIERSVTSSRNTLTFSGLTELSLILTAKDRYAELLTWASMPWGRDYE
jgi:hypothetical protein